MQNKFKAMMYGRYGWDKLNWVLLIAFIVFAFIGKFTGNETVALLAFAPIVWCVFRALSTNITARYDENYKMVCWKTSIKDKKDAKIRYKEYSKTHHHITCVSCKQKMRVPKNKGNLEIICPKCTSKFNMKT